ncbi:MAG: tRNA guanosine(34) transglycosylase Tgt, partial [Thermogutta sp.]|uniref:tRNA guanosine(34) transglycosylase Tgt n=1 Tax=Thermogutta sp. TaxID=1962930 RepID=UPI0019C4E4A4
GTGTEIILSNTYHLLLRPKPETVAALGGLHRFMGWHKPILTDSGGFQVFSLAQLTRIEERGAVFRSHLDGSPVELTPERAIEVQEMLGSDIAMVLDHVVALPNERSIIEDAMERSVRWAERCRKAHQRKDQLLFGIVQGGLEPDLRLRCVEKLVEIGFDGYAIGGLSVGESPAEMYRTLDVVAPSLPADRPRYLMGVGRPIDLLEGIARGVDMFDCVMPTRNGRNAMAFTEAGPLRMRNACHERDPRPMDPTCPCLACTFSRGYIRHLFMAREMLGPILVSLHNIAFYQRLIRQARAAIEDGSFGDFLEEKRATWSRTTTEDEDELENRSS